MKPQFLDLSPTCRHFQQVILAGETHWRDLDDDSRCFFGCWRDLDDADQGLVMIPLGNGEFSTPSMSAAHYQVHEDSFGMEQIFLSGDRDVSYNVSCATSMAACETHPGLLCDVLPSAATASSPEALSFEDAFDGDVRRSLAYGAANVVTQKSAPECESYGCFRHCPESLTCRENYLLSCVYCGRNNQWCQ